MKRVTALLLAAFLLFPFAYLVFKFQGRIFGESFSESSAEFLWALKNSVVQSFGSAALAVILGLISCSGLIWLREHVSIRVMAVLELLCLVPGLLPSLFTILVLLSLLNPFPMGLLGIAIIHAVLYAGFVGFVLLNTIEQKALSLIEVSYVLGVSRLRMWWQLSKLLKQEILSLFILVFSVCFTSFSVPVTVGGGHGTTLEILIYEKIRLSSASGGMGQALTLALLQSLILFVFSLAQRPGLPKQTSRAANIPLLGNALSAFALTLFLILFFAVFLLDSLRGWSQTEFMQQLLKDAWVTIPQSIGVGLLCGACIYILLLFVALAGNQIWLRKMLGGFVAPSTALVGLVALLLNPQSFSMQLGLFVLGFCALVLCSLYRMGFGQQLQSLQNQVDVAQVLGADPGAIFRNIVWPQVHFLSARLSGIAAMWIIGDFALAKIIFSQDVLVAQVSQGLVGSYRLNAAMATMDIVIILGLVLYYLFERFGNVRRFTA